MARERDDVAAHITGAVAQHLLPELARIVYWQYLGQVRCACWGGGNNPTPRPLPVVQCGCGSWVCGKCAALGPYKDPRMPWPHRCPVPGCTAVSAAQCTSCWMHRCDIGYFLYPASASHAWDPCAAHAAEPAWRMQNLRFGFFVGSACPLHVPPREPCDCPRSSRRERALYAPHVPQCHFAPGEVSLRRGTDSQPNALVVHRGRPPSPRRSVRLEEARRARVRRLDEKRRQRKWRRELADLARL